MNPGRALIVLGGFAYACTVYDEGLLSRPGSLVGDAAGASGQGGWGAGMPLGSAGLGGARAGSDGVSGSSGAPVGSAGRAGAGGGSAAGSSGGALGEAGASAGAAGEPAVARPSGSGTITYQRWNDIVGWEIGLLPLTQPPTELTELYALRLPGGGESYAARAVGFLTAPLDGDYRFFIACDNNCELWLGESESESGLRKLAYVAGEVRWTNVDQWDRFASQESVAITLAAGQRYRIDVRLKQEVGGSHLSVGWLEPGQAGSASPVVIPGTQLSPLPL